MSNLFRKTKQGTIVLARSFVLERIATKGTEARIIEVLDPKGQHSLPYWEQQTLKMYIRMNQNDGSRTYSRRVLDLAEYRS